MTVFDRAWFSQHQCSLRLALNTPGLGRELRSALGIESREYLTRVLPHAAIVAVDPIGRVATFHSQPVIARRLHAEYLPIWTLLHWFDQRVANPWVPAFNLGFDTLTQYPNASPETVSVDGWVGRMSVDETFASIRAGVGAGGKGDSDASGSLYLRASAVTDQYDQLRRLFFLFDTSAIGSTSTINSGTCSLWGINKDDGLGTSDFVLVSSNTANNDALDDPDFQTVGSTSFGSVAYASFTSNNTAYSVITLNASGLSAINKASITKYGARLEWDRAGTFSGTWSAGQVTYYEVNMADNVGGTANAPKLIVFYDAAPDSSAKILIGRV